MSKHPFRLLAALLCLLPAVLLICGFALPTAYQDTYLGELQHKMQLLRETPGKRLVVVGGSCVPFALDSSLMNEQLPAYRTVDFGLYADLGMPVMLDWARTEVHEGDLFILMPEQDEQVLSGFVGGESVWQAVDGAFDLLPRLGSSHAEKLAAAFPIFAGKKLRYTLLGQPKATGVYARSAFNADGDMASPERANNIMADGWQTSRCISFTPAMLTEKMADEMNRFAAYVRQHGGEVVYHFPPMNGLAVAAGADAIDTYYDALAARLDFPILGDPHRCVLDSGWFYDSNFHLNTSGAVVFTRLLIEDVKLFLRDTTATDIRLPEQPAAAGMVLRAGSDEDERCFLYEEVKGGWRLSGLTEEGKSAQKLVLPTRHEGLPVIGMADGLLHGMAALETVTVQPNIGLLPDDMFSGCAALRRVILTGKPSAYSVGDAWMRGASFVICVPEEQLDAYRRSYFWQRYEAWMQGMD